MRYAYLFLVGGMALAAMITSCTSEQENPEVDITAVRCNISRIDVEEDFATGTLDTLSATRGTFSGVNFLWSEGDKIGIVPTKGAQIYFSVNEGAGTSSALFEGGDWAMKSTGTFYAYYPLYPDIFLSKDHVSVSYTGQVQSGNNNNLHTGNYWTLYTNGTTAVGNTLNFTFDHLTSFFKTYVTVPAGTYTRITFSAPSEVFIKDGYFDLGAHPPVIVGTTFTDELSLDLQNVTFTEDTELTGYLVVAPVDITGIPITVTVYRDGEAAYEYTVTKESPMVAAKTYGFRATSLTPVVASVAQANALFASGETSVTITEPLSEDATVVLPNTEEAVSLTLPTTASTSTLTVSYAQDATACPATLAITGPEGADLNIQAPNSTVTINGVSYDLITSRTAANTCIISEGVSVNVLKVVQGGVQVYGTVSQIDLSEQEDDAIVTVSGTVSSLLGEDGEEYIPATGITLSLSSINMSVGSTETLSAAVQPVGAYPQVRWASNDETVATVSTSGVVTAVASGITTITAQTISEGFIAECIVSVIAEPEYVDFGLPFKWATFNLGASAPEEFGDYYAWGETEPYYSSLEPLIWKEGKETGYTWSSYKLCNGSYNSMTKYCSMPQYGYNGFTDDKTILDPEDDAAHVLLGDKWRMPTQVEWELLHKHCDFIWTDNYNGTGVAGTIVKGRNAGYTENSIFLPAAGHIRSTGFAYVGYGVYWSSSLSRSCPHGAFYGLLSEGHLIWTGDIRFYGQSIRPVYGDPVIPVNSISLDKAELELTIGESTVLVQTVLPDNATYRDVSWRSSDRSIAEVSSGVVTGVGAGTATIFVTTNDGGFEASCTVSVTNPPLPDYVDLGLPSGTKWASRNLSTTGLVSSPEEYGDYFAWGEVTPKSAYNWSTYDLATSGQYGGFGSLLKYNTNTSLGPVDNLTTLEPDDDAACAILGLPWRMPSLDEAQELINNCDFDNTTLNGVDGYLVTSRINGNSIFLPTAQFWETTFATGDSGCGRYWLSSLYTGYSADSKNAYRLSLRPPSYNPNRDWDWYQRSAGLSIRPVYGITQIDGISFNHSSLSLFVGQSQSLTASVSPSNATYKNLVWTSSDEAIASVSEGNVTAVSKGTVVIRASAIDGSGVFAECTVSVKPAVPSGVVDLGLSVYWASSNIGASNAVGYGNYYAWGELQPKETYTRANYLYQDHPLLLPLEHDVAHAIKGEGWRIPTKNEWRELIDNCTREWINLDGVNGLKFSSTVPGYTDKWVFIPAAGSYSTSLRYASYYGFYWTATSNSSSYSDIWYMEITDDSDFGLDYGDENGCLGYTVRPVYY